MTSLNGRSGQQKLGGTKTALADMATVAISAAIALRMPPQLPPDISRLVDVPPVSPTDVWRIGPAAFPMSLPFITGAGTHLADPRKGGRTDEAVQRSPRS
jgi:hypothetical protein